MNRPDEQLIDQVREAVDTAPARATRQPDKAVAVGRQRVRTRRAATTGGLLGVAAVTGLLLSQGGLGPTGATAPAGGGNGSLTLTSPPAESPNRLYTALDDRLESMGLPSEDVGWHTGAWITAAAVSGFGASSSSSGFTLDTARAGSAVNLTGDLCGAQLAAAAVIVQPTPGSGPTTLDPSELGLACEQLSQPDGTQLLRMSASGGDADGELYYLEIVHPGGWVRVSTMSFGPEGQTLPPMTEEKLTQIVTDPALRW